MKTKKAQRINFVTKNSELLSALFLIQLFKNIQGSSPIDFFSLVSACSDSFRPVYFLIGSNFNETSFPFEYELKKKGVATESIVIKPFITHIDVLNMSNDEFCRSISKSFPEIIAVIEEYDSEPSVFYKYINGDKSDWSKDSLTLTINNALSKIECISYKNETLKIQALNNLASDLNIIDPENESFDSKKKLEFKIDDIDQLPDQLSKSSLSNCLDLFGCFILFDRFRTYRLIDQMIDKNIPAELIILMAISMHAKSIISESNDGKAILKTYDDDHIGNMIEKVSAYAFQAEMERNGFIRNDIFNNTNIIRNFMPAIDAAKNSVKMKKELSGDSPESFQIEKRKPVSRI